MFKFVLCLIFFAVSMFASERCALLKREVRLAHYRAFGTSFPWQYGVAQLEQESGCRPSISNDGVGSQGVAQITYRWWKQVLDKEGITEIASVQGSVRAQAVIMRYLHEPGRPLWVTYQRYNGGDWVLKEIQKAGAQDWEKAKAQCTRGNSHFTLKSGKIQTRNNCDINYEYSQNIYTLGRQYGDIKDNAQFRYW
jgi:hypothetical protein